MGNPPGLRFRKLDLHTHTTKSKCYLHQEHTCDEMVQAAIDQGLEAIAVTDHNTAAGIDAMKAAAAGKPLVIFPGVEVSTGEGYHVIVLFDPASTQQTVELFLGALGFRENQLGRADEICEKSIYDVVDLAHEPERNALVILAHIDDHKGAFFELAEPDPAAGILRIPVTCVRLFNNTGYDAVEVVNGKLPDGFEAARGFKRLPAYYQASDNPDPTDPKKHSKDGLGQRYTWFKLDELTLEGLRQCFADHEVRIRQMNNWREKKWPRIISLKVGNQGFLANQAFEFHPGLNSIIGGKGVGKSLVIEFLRFALGQASEDEDILNDHHGKLDKRLLSTNTVEVECETEGGARYRITRTYHGKGLADMVCINALTGEKYEGDITRLFRILAYSQTEVIKIAEDLQAQLNLVDSLIDTMPFENEIKALQGQLEQNNRAIAGALAAREKVAELRRSIATDTETIRTIDSKLTSPLLSQMRGADAKKQVMQAQRAEVEQWVKTFQKQATDFSKRALPAIAPELATDSDVARAQARLETAREIASTAFASVLAEARAAQVEVVAAWETWQPTYDQMRQAYEAKLAGGDLSKLEVERRGYAESLEAAQRELGSCVKLADEELPELQKRRTELLDALEKQHQRYYAARKAKFDQLTLASANRLRLTLDHAQNRESYAKAVRDFWKGGGAYNISTDVRQKLADNLSPRKLVDYIIARDAPGLATEAKVTTDTAEKIIHKAWAAEDFADALMLQHAYYPDDLPSIQFNKGNDKYAALAELSVGQKCTALLIIALCDGTMPVVIDQPEDALDIASVWEDIAKKLRGGKDSRQFVLTTHNSTIAVGADSDNFMVLEPVNSERAKVTHRGAIDREKVRRGVIDHMEGGDFPYKLRQGKYNVK